MKYMKRILALLLVLSMIVPSTPLTIYAAEADQSAITSEESTEEVFSEDDAATGDSDESASDAERSSEETSSEEVTPDTEEDVTENEESANTETDETVEDETANVEDTDSEDTVPDDILVDDTLEDNKKSAGDVVLQTTALEDKEDSYTVMGASDFQANSDSAGAANVKAILEKISADYSTMDGFMFGGDLSQSMSTSASASGKTALQNTVHAYYTGMDEFYVQGNHDPDNTVGSTCTASGANDTDGYGVYVINEKDYPWGYYESSSSSSYKSTVQATANALDAYLDAKVEAEYSEPIFVLSHIPLHYTTRTSGQNDAMHANLLFDVLNEGGDKGLNIIFLFGHNHSTAYDSYLGQGAIYLAEGDKINIAQGSTTSYNEETLNFTYMNYGYVGYIGTTDADAALTMTVFEITDDEVVVKRYSKDGVHNLKAAGGSTSKPGGVSVNSTVYSSPQTIELNEFEPAAALTGITVTAPTKTAYVVGDELDTTGMVVTAAYDDGTTKEVTGYEVSADFSSAGIKTVTVSYKEKSATFEITVFAPVKDEVTGVTVAAPGITGLSVTKITEEIPADSGYGAYVSYDIDPVGDFPGTATVTVPVSVNFDVGKPVKILDGDTVLTTTTIKNGTVTFTATHFSVYALAQDAQSELEWKEIPGGIVYQLDTDGVTGGTKYLIVNTGANGDGKALQNAGGEEDTTDVIISGGTINLEDDTAVAWTLNDANSGYFKNQDEYLRIPTNSYNDLVTSSSSTISINNMGNGAYQLYVAGNSGSWPNWGSTSTYYLAYSNGSWRAVTTESNVYLYECKGTGNGGYAAMTGTTVYQVVTGTTTEDALKEQIQNNLRVYTATDENGTDAATTTEYAISGTADPNIAGAYSYTVIYGGVELGTITVNVIDKKINIVTVNELSGAVNKGASQKAETGAKLNITYDDDTTQTLPVTVGMLTNADGSPVSTAGEGTYTDLTLTYNGTVVTNEFTLTVNPKAGNNYPAYPNEGSVSLDKTATGIDFQASGVATVELSAKGIPMNQGVDVLLILDTSSSMNQQGNLEEKNTRIGVLKDCVDALIQNLKAPREDGSTPDVDIAIVHFNGYTGDKDQNYIGSKARDVDTIGGLLTDGWVSVQTLADNWGNTEGNIPQGSGTNYDHGLQQGYELLSQKQIDEPGRKQFVLFMSDGAPFQYNGVNSNSLDTDWEQWILGSYTQEGVEAIDTISNPEFYYGNNNGNGQKHRIAEAIKGSPDETYQIVSYSGTSSDDAAEMIEVAGLGATMYSVGLALEGTYMPTDVEGQEAILKTIASSEDVFYSVTSAAGLEEAFDDFATAILLAATNARFVDEMGSMYDLQLGNISYSPTGETDESKKETISQQIKVISYDIYTRKEVVDGSMDMDLIGDRKGTSTVLETVTFNADGNEAYSNGEENNNILVNGVINADTFFYNTTAEAVMIDTNGDGNTDYSLGSETFYWKIGDLKTTEMAIRYNVYLTGSLEGKREQGSYPTNNSAVLYYDNYLGNACQQSVVSPQMPWMGANVSYAFYLVDASSGKPVNMNGTEVPFSERTVIVDPTLYETILLNSNDHEANSIEIAATGVLPSGYWLYDEASAYTVSVSSNATGKWSITTGGGKENSTYVTGFKGNEYSNAATVEDTSYDYTHTTVWFAVQWQPQTVPDTIVVDYGLPVDVHVLTNDMFGDYGKLVGVTTDVVEDVKGDRQTNKITTTEVTGSFGTATVNVPPAGYTEANSLIRYTPNTMSMNDRDVFSYSVQYANPVEAEDDGFYYGTLTVIPATTIYYEDDFVTYSSYGWDKEKNGWENRSESLWSKVTDETYVSDKVITQDEDRPGNVNYAFDTVIDANNIYGYDNAYTECAKYSLGSAMKATVDYDNYGAAKFTFWGTGFDVISMTSNETGTVLVYVYDGEGNAVKTHIVDTYYGYTFENGEWVTSVNNPNALYQIPVIEIAGLEYGRYDVVLKAMYDPAFDHNNKDATFDFYLDAIRIYDPANDGFADETEDTTIEDAYIDDHEGWPVYEELRNNVIEAAVYNETSDEAVIDGIVFIDSQDKTASVEDYMNYGPNNELYLAPQQAIAFALDLSAYVDQKGASIVDTVQLGMKSTDGGVVSYKMFDASTITNQDDVEAAKATELKTSTGMYYDITELGDKTIVIYNSGTSGTLSLTDIKITFTQDPGVVENLFRVSATSVKNILNNMNKDSETNFVPQLLDISTSPSKVYVGNKITVKVTTSAEVEGISVDGALLTSYSTNREGNRIWTGKVSAKAAGTQSINVIAYNAEGLASILYSKEVTVSEVDTIGSAIGSVINRLFGWLFA